ncbi:hypothetical protein CLF_107527 [Clonorchis sinensis]|uniref:Endonuclease/exonuclease/phosphatase domain-containing protein n=1 Tax=Clonorchis sinensis TaxID=79923 RepID=G7YQQ6_CLOSI|nr:hypothetical protein CLF_107527 [Clonorchis sinensis]
MKVPIHVTNSGVNDTGNKNRVNQRCALFTVVRHVCGYYDENFGLAQSKRLTNCLKMRRVGRAGGVALYFHVVMPIPVVFSGTTHVLFCDALWIQFPLRGTNSLLGLIYRCPSSSAEDDQFLIRTLEQLSSSYHFTHLLLAASWMELQRVGSSGHFAAALTKRSVWTRHFVALTRYRAGQQPSILDLVFIVERQFVDWVLINAPLRHSDHRVLIFDFICYWARNPEPQKWIRNFCYADFSGMHIHLDQFKLGQASVEESYRTIFQKVHEPDAMFIPEKNNMQSDESQAT